MAACVVCKGELDEKVGIFISESYTRRHRLEANRTVGFSSSMTLHFAHPICVDFPDDLDDRAFRKWTSQTIIQQKGDIAAIRRSLQRINNALLALPEEKTTVFRDELEHEHRTYGDGK